MKQELEKTYNPSKNEDRIYEKWEKSGFFNPDNLNLSKTAKNYTIILPPPNITAKLHIGHSYMLAIEDLLIRYHRLRGYRTLWLPGTDHAAIATQNVVEKKILKEQGKTRHDLGRIEFLKQVQGFVGETQSIILHQIKKMGSSLDWSRLAFTLDTARQKAVKTMFLDMYQAGIIYRGERIVNWCPRCHSTLADDELEYKEQSAKFYTFRYDKNFPILISTTRPETKLGDVAVAVNPKDKRYKQYIGQVYKVNFCGQALDIKIITDRKVETDFGTGALGITPAHSMIDWQIAEDNSLAVIKVINESGNIREGFGTYSGLSVLAARELIIADLKKANLLEKEEEITNNLSLCYRCHTPVEPLPSKQWFIDVNKKLARLGHKSLKVRAQEVANEGKIKFVPERFNKRYQDWMNNLHDWCISRQIWYGHQIPAWYCSKGIEDPQKEACKKPIVSDSVPTKCPVCGGQDLIQDPDTLDTWFSSGMWTFSTLGWPDNFVKGIKTGDLAKYHPTQILETGYEILTLWVSRMVMMSLFALGEVPFEQVYLHGTILDEKGKKMSKSKGNGVDPLEIITKYGTDALRLALLAGNTPGNDMRYSDDRVEAKRNFINKLWNISRFILNLSSQDDQLSSREITSEIKSNADRWILRELDLLIARVTNCLSDLNFSLAAEELQEFTWNKLADWYLEITKIEEGKEKILIYLLKNLLILWHPFIPYITENIWSSFNDSLLMVASWPVASKSRKELNSEKFQLLQDVIIAIRNVRSINKIKPAQKLSVVIYAHQYYTYLKDQTLLIQKLKTGLDSVKILEKGVKIKSALSIVVGEVEIYLLGAEESAQDKTRLIKEKNNLERLVFNQEKKLANSNFVQRAPHDIVSKEQTKLEDYKIELNKIIKIIKQI